MRRQTLELWKEGASEEPPHTSCNWWELGQGMHSRITPEAKTTGTEVSHPPYSHFPETQISFSAFLRQERWRQALVTQPWNMRELTSHHCEPHPKGKNNSSIKEYYHGAKHRIVVFPTPTSLLSALCAQSIIEWKHDILAGLESADSDGL